ncbi:MAG: HD domain-containing protein [Desulfosudaceae bacterium]
MTRTDEHLEAIQQIVAERFATARGSHDWEHTRRVVRLARTIGRSETADLTVVTAGALLHDIGRDSAAEGEERACHAGRGARLSQEILAPLPLAAEQKDNIIHCVAAHRFRRSPDPQTAEARVVFDADKLDAIGAVGVARAYLFAGELGACLHNPDIDVTRAAAYSVNDTGYREYLVKLRWIKDRLLTETGRTLARDRHRFMTDFFRRFLDEYEGKY